MTARKVRDASPWARIIAGFLGVMVACLLAETGALERWERRTHDWRFRLRGQRATGARIVLVEIRGSTLEAWKEPMHAWGSHIAGAIEQARALGVSWIGLDLIPAVSGGQKADQDLFRAVRDAAGRVVLATARLAGNEWRKPPVALRHAHREQGMSIGFIDAPLEPDEVIRHAQVYLRDSQRFLPSFDAVLALRSAGRSPLDAGALQSVPGVSEDAEGLGTLWINYVGPPGSFPSLAVEDLAAGKRGLSSDQERLLSGAILLIGPAYDGDNDLHRGPGAEEYYRGLEIHAHALATMLDRRPLRRGSPPQEALIAAALGAVAALPTACLPFGWGLLWVGTITIGWCGAAQRAFVGDALWPVVAPVLAMGLAWVGQTGARTVQEARRRRSVEGMFGQHVSRAVVDRLLRDPAAGALGGERRLMTMLFSDIRGFTTRSEEMSPEEVVAQLNEYLGVMAECVFRTDGTIDKYIGDGVMAFWNSPLELPDHAWRGVATAWEMLQALDRLNERWAAEGHARLDIGIGLNTGEVLVGNLGSQKRMNYTVIGHAVNLAARIESANKELGTSILLGEATYEAVRDQIRVRPHTVEVRGVRERVRVFELLGFDGSVSGSPQDSRVASAFEDPGVDPRRQELSGRAGKEEL